MDYAKLVYFKQSKRIGKIKKWKKKLFMRFNLKLKNIHMKIIKNIYKMLQNLKNN